MASRASLSRTASRVWLASVVTCVAALVLLTAISASAAQNPLHVRVEKMADHVEITVIGGDPISCSRRQGVTFLALDIRGFAYPRAGRVKVMSGHIWQVRYGPFSDNPQTVRVVVSTGSRRPYTTWFSEDKRRMVVKVYKLGYTPSDSGEVLAAQAPQPDPIVSITPASMVTGEQRLTSVKPLSAAPASSSASRPQEAPVTTQPMARPRGCGVPAQAEPQPTPVRTASLSGAPVPNVVPEARDRRDSPTASRAVPPDSRRTALAAGGSAVPDETVLKPAAPSEQRPKPTQSPRTAASPPDETDTAAAQRAGDIRKRSLQARAPAPYRPGPGGEQGFEPLEERRNINLSFVSSDINDVLKALSEASGRNIVCGKDVSGQVTVRLNSVSFPEALDYVTKLSGYRYAKSGDTYVVGTTAGLGSLLGKDERIVGTRTEVMTVRVADVDEVAKAIATQVPEVKCSVGSYSAAGDEKKVRMAKVLMLSGPSDDVDVAKEIVAKVESSLSESRESDTTEVYRIKYSSPSSLLEMVSKLYPAVTATPGPSDGFELRAPVGTPIGSQSSSGGAQAAQPAGGAGGEKDKVATGILVLSGPTNDVKAALATLDQVDRRPAQILIEAKVTDLRVTLQKRLGLQWNWSSFGLVQRTGSLDAVQNPVDVAGTFTHTPVTIKSVLDAFIENGDANLLANPRVAAVEGKPAEIFIGDEIRYVINVQQTVQGQNITTETATVGIQLRVIADVSPDGYITLNLHPEVSVVSDYIRIGTGGGTDIVLPQIARRYTDSVIRVKDGETVVIGGLIRDQDIQTMRKVPFLGDIPFFGELFKKREKNKEHSEIVVFITCSIVED